MILKSMTAMPLLDYWVLIDKDQQIIGFMPWRLQILKRLPSRQVNRIFNDSWFKK